MVAQRFERHCEDAVAAPPFDVSDKTNPASVMFEAWVIQALCAGQCGVSGNDGIDRLAVAGKRRNRQDVRTGWG